MNAPFLRLAANAAVKGEQVFAEAAGHLAAIRAELDRGEYAFAEMPSPRGSRAFQSANKAGCQLLVVQFNHETDGIGHAGTAIRNTSTGPLIINLPTDLADYAYHKAAATRN